MIRIELDDHFSLSSDAGQMRDALPAWWGGKVVGILTPQGGYFVVQYRIRTKGWLKHFDALRMRAITRGLERNRCDYIVDRTDEPMRRLK